jgi:hypothetical protein
MHFFPTTCSEESVLGEPVLDWFLRAGPMPWRIQR